MSEFKNQYMDVYRADLNSMLDMAEELPLFHTPRLSLLGNPYTDETRIIVDGQLVAETSLTPAAKQIRAEVAVGQMNLHGLGTRAEIQLLVSELDKVIPSDTNVYTPEQAELADIIDKNVKAQIQTSTYRYSAYYFIDEKTGENISVVTCQMKGDSPVRARSLNLAISDGHVSKEISITEMPTSFDGATEIDVHQTIRPVNDETIMAAAELFEASGHPEDMAIITKLFTAGLQGSEDANEDVENLLARYQHSDRLEELQRILEEVKQKAQAAKMSISFGSDHPDLPLPSADELAEYNELLGILLA